MVNLNDSLNDFSDPEKSIPENLHDSNNDGHHALKIDKQADAQFIDKENFSFNNTQKNGFTIADEQGNVSFQIDEEGNSEFNINNQFASKLKALIYPPDLGLADINHIIAYGQSLAEGTKSYPLLSGQPFSPYAKMFNHGIRTRFAGGKPYQTLVDHIERQDPPDSFESPSAGTAEMFIREIELHNFKNKLILSSNCAHVSQSILNLSKGNSDYQNIINDVQNGKRIATEQGKSYRLLAITFTQGESDYNCGINWYKAALRKLRADLIEDIEKITGDDYSDLPFITYQISSSFSADNVVPDCPDVALAQLELALEQDSGFYLATPIYQLHYQDKWHIDGPSSKLLGTYYGYVLSKVISGENWQPLHPISHTINGKFLNLKFNKSGLTFDKPEYFENKNLTIPNRGFSIKNSVGKEIITNVERLSDDNNCDTLRIECKESPKNLIITYGFFNIENRNAGELHDNNNIVYRIGNEDYHLYNWCVIFNYYLREQQS